VGGDWGEAMEKEGEEEDAPARDRLKLHDEVSIII
jgi:hypothetical protein